jgi:enoyl-CoA hydratase/carnithine racemase
MPTVALVNGHAFAGGFMLAIYHDYRIFNPSRGFLCLNELDLGVPLRPAMSSIFRQKLTPDVYKIMVLEAKRFGAKEALESKIVDGLGGFEEAMKMIADRKLVDKAQKGVYRALKKEMFRETLAYLENSEEEGRKMNVEAKKEDVRGEEARRRVNEWKRNAPSKL